MALLCFLCVGCSDAKKAPANSQSAFVFEDAMKRVCAVYFDQRRASLHSPQAPYLDAALLKQSVDSGNFASIEELLRWVRDGSFAESEQYPFRFAWVHHSDSVQATAPDAWRNLLFNPLADLALGVRGKRIPEELEADDDIEVVFFRCPSFHVAVIRYEPSLGKLVWYEESQTIPFRIDPQQLSSQGESTSLRRVQRDMTPRTLCAACHAGQEAQATRETDMHLNWYDYESWNGIAGGEHASNSRLSGEDGDTLSTVTWAYPWQQESLGIDRFVAAIDWDEHEDATEISRYALIRGLRSFVTPAHDAPAPFRVGIADYGSGYYGTLYESLSVQNTAIAGLIADLNSIRLASQWLAVLAKLGEDSPLAGFFANWHSIETLVKTSGDMQPGTELSRKAAAKHFCTLGFQPEHNPGCDCTVSMWREYTEFLTGRPQFTHAITALRRDLSIEVSGLYGEVLRKTGTIRQDFYQRAAASFDTIKDAPAFTDSWNRTYSLQEVQAVDSVDAAGRGSYDAEPSHLELMGMMLFAAHKSGLSARHWSTTPRKWGASYQFILGDRAFWPEVYKVIQTGRHELN